MKKAWIYRHGSFEMVSIDYPEPEDTDPEKDYTRMGFNSSNSVLGDPNGTFSLDWYEHEDSTNLEKDVPYRFLMIVATSFRWYEIFIPELPDLLNFLKEYHSIIPTVLGSDKALLALNSEV